MNLSRAELLDDRARLKLFTSEDLEMKKIIVAAALVGFVFAGSTAAEAKGCIKGAVVGGVAGHYAHHHGVLGAAAGCVIGRHEAKKHAREKAHQDSGQGSLR